MKIRHARAAHLLCSWLDDGAQLKWPRVAWGTTRLTARKAASLAAHIHAHIHTCTPAFTQGRALECVHSCVVGCGCRNSWRWGGVLGFPCAAYSRRVAARPLRPSRVRVRKSVLSVDDVAMPGCAVAGLGASSLTTITKGSWRLWTCTGVCEELL